MWKRAKNKWDDFWIGDEYDDSKKHLSQSDKRFLLYGNFITGICTVALALLFSGINNLRISYRSDADMKEIINIIKSYIEVATEDEYDNIAQTIRHDLTFSDIDEDIEKYVQYISNSSYVCHACEESYSAQVSLVNLNPGDAYSLNLFEHEIDPEACQGSVQLIFGYDEISKTSIRILKNLEEKVGYAEIERKDGIVSIHKMKRLFCDNCIAEILKVIKNQVIEELVIFDTDKKIFILWKMGKRYRLETIYWEQNIKTVVIK